MSSPYDLSKSQPRVSRWVVVATFLALLGVGLVLADDYGSSWDERGNFRAGRDALASYLSEQHYLSYLHNGQETLGHHGSSYFMLYWLIAKGMDAAIPGWDLAAGRHFVNYLTFLLAVSCMYVLARRMLPRNVAWAVPVLFATQPLLFGHAFINQKDVPFLAFFLACVTAGISFVDWMSSSGPGGDMRSGAPGLRQTLQGEWQEAAQATRLLIVAIVVVPLAFIAELFLGRNLLDSLHSIVSAAYAGEAWGPVTTAFRLVAEDSYKTSVEEYQFKVTWAFWLARIAIMLLLVGAGCWVGSKVAPRTSRTVRHQYRRVILLIVLQGILLGFTISIRPIGAFAGMLLIVYWMLRIRWRDLGLLLPYFAAASVTMYLTWPYLWQDPFGALWSSLGYSARFGSLMVLFRSNHINSDELPWDYLPTLFALQLTLTAGILFLAGLPLVARWLYKRDDRSPAVILLLLWLGLPLLTLIYLGGGIYNGIRQMLFLLPPILAIGGVALGTLLNRLRSAPARVAVVILVVLPGLLGIRNLHPYEYAYFNEFVGGPGGAAGKYELDYWCTSLRESIEFVNRHAEPDAIVVAYGPYWAAKEFARPDLKVRLDSTKPASFVITCSFGLETPPPPDEFSKLFDVRRGSAILGSVYERQPE